MDKLKKNFIFIFYHFFKIKREKKHSLNDNSRIAESHYEMYSFFCSAALLLSFHTKNKIPLNYMIVEVGIIYLFILTYMLQIMM